MLNGSMKQAVVCGVRNNPGFTFKIIRKSPSESKSVDFHSQFISVCLSEQAGCTHSLEMCALNLENRGLNECQEDSDSVKTNSRES